MIRRSLLIAALCTPLLGTPALATGLSIPHPVHVRLADGLDVLVVERHDLPIVSVDLIVRAGANADPQGKEGLADMTASMLTRGTLQRSAEAIADEIDSLGATLGASAGSERSEVSLSILKRDLDAGLAVMGDVVSHPSFADSELAKSEAQEEASLKSDLDDPDRVVSLTSSEGLFGRSPYGRPVSGGLHSVLHLRVEDLEAFYRKAYDPRDAFMVVVGDVTPQEVAARFAKPFADWHSHQAAVSSEDFSPAFEARGSQLVDMDLSQANVKIAYPAIKRTDPDYYALMVATQILGGGYLSRLYKHVREDHGLVYNISADNRLFERTGENLITFQTKEESLNETLKAVFDQVADLREHRVSEQELAAIKNYFLGRFPRDLEANSDLADLFADEAFYGLGDDYLDHFVQRIQAVTAEDVQRVARKYYDPSRRLLSVAGHAGALRQTLQPYGPLRELARTSLIQ